MSTAKQRWVSLAASAMLAVSGGCGLINFSFVPSRTNDGGGGNVLTAGLKIVGNQMTTLTQDEIQQLADAAAQVVATVDPALVGPELTNEQADAFLDFIQANNINSLDDAAALADQAAMDPGSIVIPDSLIAAFAGTGSDIDPNNPNIDALFAMVFGNQ